MLTYLKFLVLKIYYKFFSREGSFGSNPTANIIILDVRLHPRTIWPSGETSGHTISYLVDNGTGIEPLTYHNAFLILGKTIKKVKRNYLFTSDFGNLRYKNIIGMTLGKANELAETFGYRVRAVKIDDNLTVCTRDCNQRRINVELKNGFITHVTGIG